MNRKSPDVPVHILLAEDNTGDIRLTQEVFKEERIPSVLHVVQNGDDALAFLRKQGKFAHAVRPDLILLDLNLPKRSGIEVLQEIKSDRALARIPVVVLTTSKAEEDIAKSYDSYANCFITKPLDFEKFISVAASIREFWFRVAELPQRRSVAS